MITVGKPFLPSTMLEHKEINMTEITISCGGGMGGSRWEVYTKDTFDLNDKFISISTNVNKHHNINTNNIIQTQAVKVLKISLRNDGNPNMKQKVGTVKNYYYLVPNNEEIKVLDNEFVHVNDTPLKEIVVVE